MRVLLIFPPNIHVIDPFQRTRMKSLSWVISFPIGLGYLAAVLEKNGFEVTLYNTCSGEEFTAEMIRKRIIDSRPDVVGISVYTALAKTAVAVARMAKEINPGVKVVMGGPHATYDHENLLKHYPVDFVVLGEGEMGFLELLKKVRDKKNDFESVKGIAFLRGKVLTTEKRSRIEDLDALPFPARHLVDFKKCIKNELLPNAVSIMTSRGCTHSCAFCSLTHFFGRWKPRSPQNVVNEMKHLLKTYDGIKSFQFYDDNFTCDRNRVIELCNLMVTNGLHKFKWNCLARADQVDPQILKLMKKAGCEKVSFGVESGSPDILKNIHKGISLEIVKSAFEVASQAGIEALGFFIIGNPGETPGTIRKTLRFAKRLKSTSTLWTIAQIFPGTEFARRMPQSDFTKYLYEPEINRPYPFLHPCVPVFEQPGLDREKLKKIHASLVRRFLIWHSLGNFRTYLKHFCRSPINSLKYAFSLFKN